MTDTDLYYLFNEQYLYTCDALLPSGQPCPNPATTEYTHRDEDGSYYSTDRCDDHPCDDPDFQAHDL